MKEQHNFHDGSIDGLISFNKEARLFLRTAAQKKFTLVLRNVDALVARNFRQGDVILEVEIVQPAELDVVDIRDLNQRIDEDMKTFPLNDWRTTTQQQGLEAVVISPSYGCTLVATFKSTNS